VSRGIVLNKHKIRYWLSVGAEPTKGVVRLLNQFDFYPKTPVPWGSDNLYEKPDKVYQLEGWKDHFKSHKNASLKYRQMLQEQINVVERQRRIQAEAMANLGEGQQDLELIKTDDIESEEADIFQRVEKFNELNKRFEKHRKEQW
jgi:flagellar biosynthesis GTPase FlhF